MGIKVKKVELSAREKSQRKVRKTVKGTDERPRVSVFRSSKHTYAQVISDNAQNTLAFASTREKDVLDQIGKIATGDNADKTKSSKGVLAARAVGIVLAGRCLQKNVKKVVFDRSGFVYKGRVKAVAEGAREGGLDF